MGTEMGKVFKQVQAIYSYWQWSIIINNYIPSKYNESAKYHPLGKKFATG